MIAVQVRPTKKERELLAFIETFIAEDGYSPRYREIMVGMHYNSVATVALHVNSLIKRGHLLRRDGKARSLEVAHPLTVAAARPQEIAPSDEKWLIDKIEQFFLGIEDAETVEEEAFDQLTVLLHALRILGFDAAAQSFAPRLHDAKAAHNRTHKSS